MKIQAKKILERLKNIKDNLHDTGYFCLICDTELKDYTDKYGELHKLYYYRNDSVQYCRECNCKIYSSSDIIKANPKALEIMIKNDADRATQLQVLQAKELMHYLNSTECEPAYKERNKKCYVDNIKSLHERFVQRECLL